MICKLCYATVCNLHDCGLEKERCLQIEVVLKIETGFNTNYLRP